jgi:hypothetical protein
MRRFDQEVSAHLSHIYSQSITCTCTIPINIPWPLSLTLTHSPSLSFLFLNYLPTISLQSSLTPIIYTHFTTTNCPYSSSSSSSTSIESKPFTFLIHFSKLQLYPFPPCPSPSPLLPSSLSIASQHHSPLPRRTTYARTHDAEFDIYTKQAKQTKQTKHFRTVPIRPDS